MHRLQRLELAGEVDPATLTRWLFILVWAVSTANALVYLNRGWFPHDLGTLAQPAARVLRGQWPHRDFEDVYTGGLALLDGLTFKVLGVSAMSLRWALFAVYVLWVPVVWYLARRVAGPALAAAGTLLAAAWTLPMYAEGMPSWYNLFLATFGTAAFFRWTEVRRRRWLFLAGVAGGLSIVVKIVGLYFVAGGLLFLAYAAVSEEGEGAAAEKEEAARGNAEPMGSPAGQSDPKRAISESPSGDHHGARRVRALLVVASVALAALVAGLVVRAMGVEGLLRFGIPAMAPPVALAVWIGRRGSAGEAASWRPLASATAPFLAGVALPVVLFALPYAATDALGALLRGVFVLPTRRFASAKWGGLQGHGLGAALAAGAVVWVWWAPWRRGAAGLLGAVGAALLLAAAVLESAHTGVYRASWEAIWWLPPAVMLFAGARVVARGMPPERARRTFALFSVYGLVSLVEVPFAAPVYFFYAAPLMVLLSLALVGAEPARRRAWATSILVFLLGFTVLRLNPGFIRNLGFTPAHGVQTRALALRRAGGLRVDAAEKKEYETVVRLVEAHAGGPYIYATPDCPEVYFLSARLNPTGTLFEFLDPTRNAPSRILDTLDRSGVRVVVVNRTPLFSPPIDSALVAGLQARYPVAQEVGRFLVVWRASADTAGPPAPAMDRAPEGGAAAVHPLAGR